MVRYPDLQETMYDVALTAMQIIAFKSFMQITKAYWQGDYIAIRNSALLSLWICKHIKEI